MQEKRSFLLFFLSCLSLLPLTTKCGGVYTRRPAASLPSFLRRGISMRCTLLGRFSSVDANIVRQHVNTFLSFFFFFSLSGRDGTQDFLGRRCIRVAMPPQVSVAEPGSIVSRSCADLLGGTSMHRLWCSNSRSLLSQSHSQSCVTSVRFGESIHLVPRLGQKTVMPSRQRVINKHTSRHAYPRKTGVSSEKHI